MNVVAAKVPFGDLCQVCEKISTKQGKENKQKVLSSFISCWRNFHNELHKDDPTTDDSFFPAMRLLLPQYEKDRGAYGIKEVTLAKLYIEILCLSKGSEHALKLLNYRAPSSAKAEAGDFAGVAYVVLKNRCPEKGTLNIQEVNDCLDSIATNNAAKNKDAVKKSLLRLLHNTSAIEQKWLIRMIMKSLKIGLSEQTVFSLFHPDARDLFDVSNSLAKVCTLLRDPNVRLNEIEISLFAPFRPMLADTTNPNKIEKQMETGEFVVETKYDGERMQVHIEGDQYMYFSRNGYDFTSSFGASPLEGTLTKYISSRFDTRMKSCILDAEMVGYNIDAKCIGSKGENFDVKSLKDGDEYQPCLCVFDILLYNDTVLTNKPLRQRLRYLEDLFAPAEGRLQFSSREPIKTKQEVIQSLNQAIDNREEGIVIKDVGSIYKPNTRKGGWYKIKPDYVDNLVEQVDLLIIGGYFGEGRRRGLISHFLLGVAETPKVQGELPKAFHSFCRVGSGYTLKELYDLCLKLNDHWHPYDRRHPPPNIIIGSGQKERPDLWIEPDKSHIVQVKAAEITKSDKFDTGCTLRFPRVEKVRYDKEWHESLTWAELEEIQKNAEGKLASRLFEDDTDSGPSPKKKRTVVKTQKPITIATHLKGIDPESVEKVGDLFTEKEICVINGPPGYSKQDLEKIVVENGGTVVQNPGRNTYCVLAHNVGVHVKNLMRTNDYNIVKSQWLLQCVKEHKLLKWTPMDMLSTGPDTLQVFAKEYDKYGDHFTEPVNIDDLRKIFQEIESKDDYEVLSNESMAELEQEYFPNTSQMGMFRTCKAYVDRYDTVNDASTTIPFSMLELIEMKYRFHGGTVHPNITDETSHVIIHTRDTKRRQLLLDINKQRNKKFFLVDERWVNESLINNTMLAERHFQPM